MQGTTTLDLSWNPKPARREDPRPGVVIVLQAGEPACVPLALASGVLEVGRGHPLPGSNLDDRWMSRQHVRFQLKGETWEVTDLNSRNGTAVDGDVLRRPCLTREPRVVRAGTSLFLLRADVTPYQGIGVGLRGSMVVGPTLGAALQAVVDAGRQGTTVHLVGESGSGKELAARTFHDFGPRASGPFVAVNCAAIPEGVAERLLFGARKGAYSGADAHADGYVQAAQGGTLFLDEVAELDPAVQAKLLRVLENREVLPVGAARPQAVDLHICSATHKDLRSEVAAGRLREDLYYRLSRPEVVIPPLRERLEEIPLLALQALVHIDGRLTPHASLIEACMLRHWPGNVRELVAELRSAARAALAESATVVEERHLPNDAGHPIHAEPATQRPREALGREDIEAVLQAEGGNVSQAARVLGLHRTQLRRLMARHGLQGASGA